MRLPLLCCVYAACLATAKVTRVAVGSCSMVHLPQVGCACAIPTLPDPGTHRSLARTPNNPTILQPLWADIIAYKPDVFVWCVPARKFLRPSLFVPVFYQTALCVTRLGDAVYADGGLKVSIRRLLPHPLSSVPLSPLSLSIF